MGCAVGAATRGRYGSASDCVNMLVGLSNEQAQHEAELQRLRDRLRQETWQLDQVRDLLVQTEAEIDRTIDDLNAHGCR